MLRHAVRHRLAPAAAAAGAAASVGLIASPSRRDVWMPVALQGFPGWGCRVPAVPLWKWGLGSPLRCDEPRDSEKMPGFADYEVTLDMFALTALIYAYGKDPDFKLKPSDTVRTFIERTMQSGDAKEVIGVSRECHIASGERLLAREPDLQVLDFVDMSDSTHLQAAVTVSKSQRRIVVVFRGSESGGERTYMDWLHNFMVLKTEVHGVHVHRGFNAQLEPAYPRILKEVKQSAEANPSFSIYVTGHSLGGALSTLFGFRAANDEPGLSFNVVSFASPRVGNYNFADMHGARSNLKHTRVSNEGDLVCSIPWVYYQHCGNNIKLLKDKPAFHKVGGASYNSWWEYSLFNNLSVKAHDCDEYYKKLIRFKW